MIKRLSNGDRAVEQLISGGRAGGGGDGLVKWLGGVGGVSGVR